MSEEKKEKTEETSAAETKKKKSFLSENAVEILVAVFLGITALLTAYLFIYNLWLTIGFLVS